MLKDIKLLNVCPRICEVQTAHPQQVKAWVYVVIEQSWDDCTKQSEVRTCIDTMRMSLADARQYLYNRYTYVWKEKFPDHESVIGHYHIGRKSPEGICVKYHIEKRPVF